jgi:hypothetical protein
MTTALDAIYRLCPRLWLAPGETLLPSNLEALAADKAASADKAETPSPKRRLYYHWSDDAGGGSPCVTYVHVYARDGGIHGIGSHAMDAELVRFYYDPVTLAVRRAFYAQHGRDQGMWLHAGSSSRPPPMHEGRPVVFVARSSHASYPGAGTWVRGFCCANDKTGRGTLWDPLCDGIDALAPLDMAAFEAAFGTGGAHKQWAAAGADLAGSPSGRLANLAFRLFYPLSARVRAACC